MPTQPLQQMKTVASAVKPDYKTLTFSLGSWAFALAHSPAFANERNVADARLVATVSAISVRAHWLKARTVSIAGEN